MVVSVAAVVPVALVVVVLEEGVLHVYSEDTNFTANDTEVVMFV